MFLLQEEELISNQREQLFCLHKFLRDTQADLDDFCKLLPGMLHLNRINSVELVYLDKTCRDMIEIEKEKVEKDGMKVLSSFIDPTSLPYLKKINETADFSDDAFILSTFQPLSFHPTADIKKNKHKFTWCLSNKKKFSDDLTISLTHPLDNLGKVYHQLNKVIEENIYLKKNFRKLEQLTKREREILRLIAKGIPSEHIAEMLFISLHTVNTHRKNIWYKLEIKNYTELIKFAEHFDLL